MRSRFRQITRRDLAGDFTAGLTVAALVLPLSLGLAVTAGLPPQQGLYASMLPLVAFAVVASSRHTMIGPDASVTALIVASVVPLAGGSASLPALVAALAIAAGVLCLAAAAVGAGRLASLLNESSLIGYLAGLAIVVAVAQLPRIARVSVEAERTLETLVAVGARLGQVHPASALLGAGTVALVVLARARRPTLPWMLIAVALAALVSELAGLPERGVATIGELPSGLPPIAIPAVGGEDLVRLVPVALAIAAVTFADTMATATAFAARHDDEFAPGRELAALGAADIAAGLSGGMPVSASGARTAAADAAGGRTQLTGVFAAAAVAVVLAGGGSALSTLPLAALGGVVIAAVIPMVDVQSLARLRRLERDHFAGALLVALAVAVVGVLEGIVVALAVSVLQRVFARGR